MSYPANEDFNRGRVFLDASTYPANADFSSGTLDGWTTSGAAQVTADGGSGPHLLIGDINQWVQSSAFTIPAGTHSLQFDYLSWAARDPNERSRLYVEVFSGPTFSAYTPLSTIEGAYNDGWRHAVVDVQRFAGQTIKVEVPLHVVGQEESPGLKNGGALQIVEHSLEIEVAPERIPEFIEVSVAGLEVGDTLHGDALKLPAGVTLTATRELTLVTIIPPTVEEEAPAAEEAEAEAAKA